MTLRLVVLFTVSILFAGCIAGNAEGDKDVEKIDPSALAPPSDGQGRILGTVTDDTLAPIVGAQVGIPSVPASVIQATNEAGQFILGPLDPGTYAVNVQKLGFESAVRNVEVSAGETTEISFTLNPIDIGGELYFQTLIGEGYFACGAYLVVTSWGNLDACVWDDHKPRFEFEAPKKGLFGIQQELVWQQSSGLTAQNLQVYLQYKPVCDPFCSAEKEYAAASGGSPITNYVDFEDDAPKFEEDPIPLASMTFPDGDNTPVIVFQQRMTHYITLAYNAHLPEDFVARPDA